MILSESVDAVEVWKAPFFEQAPKAADEPSLEELREEARQAGYADGLSQGLSEGRAQAAQMVDAIASVAEQMTQPFAHLDTVVTRELAEMAMQLTRHLLRRELQVDASVVTSVVEEAVATLYKLEGEVTIFIHPEDARQLRGYSPEALEGKNWKFVEDDAMTIGGCQVKSQSSFVDASVERQLDELFANLLAACDREQG